MAEEKKEALTKKRDGRVVRFNAQKIVEAISKANEEVQPFRRLSQAQIEAVAEEIRRKAEDIYPNALPIEGDGGIQDLVEQGIMEMRCYEVAQKYVRYRYKRELSRKVNTTDDGILSLIDLANQDAKDENSNKNPVINSTQRDYMAGITSRDLTERVLLPDDIVKAHREGLIHFHDSDYFAQKEHNCFTGGTKFVTDKGERMFRNFQDGEEVWIRDKDGVLRLATVHKYGQKKMQKITFKSGRMVRSFYCTPDHRWILKDGTVTTDIKIGDKLYPLKDSTTDTMDLIDSKQNAFAFCIGFIVGDGCDHSVSDQDAYTQVRLCGEKTQYASVFKRAGFRIHPMKGSSDLMAVSSVAYKQNFLNGKSWRYMSNEGKILAFRGYYAADGAKNANKVCTVDERVCSFIEETASFSGYYISSMTEEIRDTPYKKDSKLYAYHFIKSNPDNLLWTVVSIERYKEAEAYCVEEPVTHSFTLAGGVVTGNCDLINLEDMLQNGTVISGTMIEKPKSFATACNVATQIVACVASSQYGGQSFSLAHLAPFVDVSRQKIRTRKVEEFGEAGIDYTDEQLDKIVENEVRREIKDGMQTIQYQLVTLMTSNGQTPFVSVFVYLDEVDEGRTRDDLALMIEEMLRQRIKGTQNEKGVWVTPAFPKILYVLDEDNIYPQSRYYYLTELAAECTAKRMVPDYISAKVMRELKGDVYPCMGCRSFLTPDNPDQPEGLCNADNKAKAGNYKEGQHKYYGRFNAGVVTINLVDVACSAVKASEEKGTDRFNEFWKIFDERLELCHKALKIRHDRLLGTPSDVAPILWQFGALARLDKGEVIDPLLYGNYSTLSLGYAGLYETCLEMTGKSHTDPEAKPFALSVMQHMDDKCAEWRASENISYSLYGTPLESTTYKFAKCLQKRFGEIPGVTDHGYVTNSYHQLKVA